MQIPQKAWFLFGALCLIWGSSFVLMKIGMFATDGSPVLSAWHVAGLRIFTSGLVLLPFLAGAWRRVPASLRGIILISGWLGSFIPAVLFCLAEKKIDSALAGTLNALTPLSTLLAGFVLYRIPVAGSKVTGILIGLAGCVWLFLSKTGAQSNHPAYAMLVVLATLCYGWNVHMVREKLAGVSAQDIAALAFGGLVPFSFLLLLFTGLFGLPLSQAPYLKATFAASLLGILGTAFASILFYRLVKTAGALFASLVTYGTPFVALGWGVVYGEKITIAQVAALGIILGGVYLANREYSKSPAAEG